MIKKYSITLCLCLGLIIPSHAESKMPPIGYAALTAGTLYLAGNIYARLVERAAYYRFNDEIEQLQHLDAQDGIIALMLQKHYSNIYPGIFTQLSRTVRLLPTCAVDPGLATHPFVQHRKDISNYLDHLWWAQWWTLFTRKYDDLGRLRICLKQIKDVITTDYRYTKELRSLTHKI